MDVLRNGYYAKMQTWVGGFFPPAPIVWYRVAPGTPVYPGVSPFRSRNYIGDPNTDNLEQQDVGERDFASSPIRSERLPYYNGEDLWQYPATNVCGDPDTAAWGGNSIQSVQANGGATPIIATDASGSAPCCHPAIAPIAGGQGEAPAWTTFGQSTRMFSTALWQGQGFNLGRGVARFGDPGKAARGGLIGIATNFAGGTSLSINTNPPAGALVVVRLYCLGAPPTFTVTYAGTPLTNDSGWVSVVSGGTQLNLSIWSCLAGSGGLHSVAVSTGGVTTVFGFIPWWYSGLTHNAADRVVSATGNGLTADTGPSAPFRHVPCVGVAAFGTGGMLGVPTFNLPYYRDQILSVANLGGIHDWLVGTSRAYDQSGFAEATSTLVAGTDWLAALVTYY